MTAGMDSMRRLVPVTALVASLALIGVGGRAEEAEKATETESASAGVMLLSGQFLPGRIERISAGGLRIEGREQEIPFYEVQELRLSNRRPDDRSVDLDLGPLVRFRGGESLVGRDI